MSTLKGILFNQAATDAINGLIETLQTKYTKKKGRRFNSANITYEISRPHLNGNSLEFEISSKIPQDEIKDDKEMKTYFQEIKKKVNGEKDKPVSIEMENIVWDSKKDSEKERDYVKLLYSYPLDDLFNDKKVQDEYETVRNDPKDENLPHSTGAMTVAGGIVLKQVRETIFDHGMNHINQLMEANKTIRAQLKK